MGAAVGLTSGTVVGGDFLIQEPLGAGGMGVVYVSEQLSTGRRRALKIMHQQLTRDPKQRERFVREARVGALIKSRHVVDVVAAGVEEKSGMPWIAMELLEGEDLASLLGRAGSLPAQQALPLIEQLCHALAAAHDAGVVHRDIKPENVFVAEPQDVGGERLVKVLDFGIARLAADGRSGSTTVIGSPAWMAPEQAEPDSPINPATDVWPVGLLTFWMLVGAPYWRSVARADGSIHAVMKEVLFDALPPATRRAAELGQPDLLPAGFDDWYDRCVHREPRARFPNARELWSGLRALYPREADEALPVPSRRAERVGPSDTLAMSTRSFLHSGELALSPMSRGEPVDREPPAVVEHTVPLLPDPHAEEEPAPAARRAGAAPSPPSRARMFGAAAVGVVALLAALLWWRSGAPIVPAAPAEPLESARPEPTATASLKVPAAGPTSSAVASAGALAALATDGPPQELLQAASATSSSSVRRPPPPPKRKPRPFPESHARGVIESRKRAAADFCGNTPLYAGGYAVGITFAPDGSTTVDVSTDNRSGGEHCVRGSFVGIELEPFDGPPRMLSVAVVIAAAAAGP